ncbi:17223_t:CDS:2, partial [Gigaspora rosea]
LNLDEYDCSEMAFEDYDDIQEIPFPTLQKIQLPDAQEITVSVAQLLKTSFFTQERNCCITKNSSFRDYNSRSISKTKIMVEIQEFLNLMLELILTIL